MFDYIEKLRAKPEQAKRRIAIGVAFGFSFLVFIFWIFSVVPDIGQEQQISDRVQSASPSPFAALTQIFSQGTSGIGDKISKIKSAGTDALGSDLATSSDTSVSAEATSTGVQNPSADSDQIPTDGTNQ
jgi:hypothetical protein